MKRTLPPVISVDIEKCKNCHSCIAACPVKICIDGSGEKVVINHDLCIGCGKCIEACSHEARSVVDDTALFLDSLKSGEDIVAIVAPAAAAVFEENFLRLNTWLRKLGVKAVFDVSFGAELTVKSYLEHIKRKKPEAVIAQPCPAIVTYIELYRPELLKYLAPADSPMMHTVKMIKHFYPEHRNSRIAAISPCPAKKREFAELGLDVMNVTMLSLKKHMDRSKVNLEFYEESSFDNPPAERAVLFSKPGGLLETAERELPGIAGKTRKIEGPDIVYKYLDSLPDSIMKGKNPLLIDCLNCEAGCNGGPGTGNAGKEHDELEYHVRLRSEKLKKYYGADRKGFPASLLPFSRNIKYSLQPPQTWKSNLSGPS